ncbi:tape measure protein [Moraxella bovis]|uniref:tape measure protein n=1 Tax=Moraxella bovis TaxID=476 RepID=UPI0022277269|nr:tape measure protein [Moraxella bovis]UZA25228.1 tape measure protein [Moraxella bovis]UZA29288.1 tape measure protein [Moraxella bovis]
MAKVLSRLDILLHANTANYVREMKRATDQTKKDLKSVADYGKLVGGHLGMAFAGLGSAVSISHIMQTADRMQDLASKVRINTQTTEEYNAVLQDLRKISTDYWTTIDGVTDLYASSKRALDSLGASQRQVLDFTRNITMAMSVGGGSAQAQEAALVQLGQAMSMGALRGQEFNSVSAQAPVIIDLLTDSLKVSRGELRSMAAEGKITSRVMMNAVLGGYDKLQETINKMPTTFAQGIQNIKSQYDFLVDDIMNQNSLLSQNLANVALWVAENFRTLVSAGAIVGAVWLTNVARNSALVASFTGLTSATLASTRASIANAFSVQGQINAYNVLSTRMMLLRMTKTHYINLTTTAIATTANYARSLVGLATSFNTAIAAARMHTLAIAGVATAKRTAMGVGILATRAVTGLGGAFMALGRVITAHPIIALTAVIGAVIARTEGLSGAVKSLGEAFSVAGILAVDFVGSVVDGLGTAWTATSNYFSGLMGGSANATSFAQTAFGGFFAGTHKGFVGVLQITARVFDLAGATIVTFAQYAWKNISSLGTAIVNVFKGVGNFVAMVFENIINNQINKINVIIDGMNAISGMFGGGQVARLAQVSIGRMEYGATNFGFGGFTAAVAQNNAHHLEYKVVNAYEQVQQSANRASGANLGLAGAMADVGSAGSQAGKGAKNAADANKLVGKSADEASKALKELEDNFKSQLAEWERAEWDMSTPFVSELSKIEFEITSTSGKFHIASEAMKADLRKLAREMDTAKANFELHGTYTDAMRQMHLSNADGSKYLEMAYDLQDTANALHLAGEEQKKQILSTLATLEAVTKARELQKQTRDSRNELALLGVEEGMARELFAIEQQRTETLGQYNHLLKDGHTEQYKVIEMAANALEQEQKKILVTKEYHSLAQSLKTDEEKRLETLKSQLNG